MTVDELIKELNESKNKGYMKGDELVIASFLDNNGILHLFGDIQYDDEDQPVTLHLYHIPEDDHIYKCQKVNKPDWMPTD